MPPCPLPHSETSLNPMHSPKQDTQIQTSTGDKQGQKRTRRTETQRGQVLPPQSVCTLVLYTEIQFLLPFGTDPRCTQVFICVKAIAQNTNGDRRRVGQDLPGHRPRRGFSAVSMRSTGRSSDAHTRQAASPLGSSAQSPTRTTQHARETPGDGFTGGVSRCSLMLHEEWCRGCRG